MRVTQLIGTVAGMALLAASIASPAQADGVLAGGRGDFSQRGDEKSGFEYDTYRITVPVAVKDPSEEGQLSGVTAIVAGGFHNLAIKDGNVYAWGSDRFGALGKGRRSSNVPLLVLDLEVDLIAVAAEGSSSYALAAGSQCPAQWRASGGPKRTRLC